MSVSDLPPWIQFAPISTFPPSSTSMVCVRPPHLRCNTSLNQLWLVQQAQIRCAKCLPCAYSGRKRARRQTIKWYAVPTNLCPASSTRTLPTFPPEVAKSFSAALRPAMPPPTIITSYLLLLPSKSILKLSKSFLCHLQSNKRIARTIYKIGDFCLLSCSLSWSNSNGSKGRLQIKIRKIIIENKGSQGHGLSTVGAKINDVYFNNILDEQISFFYVF